MHKSDWYTALEQKNASELLERLYGSEAGKGRRRIQALLEQAPENKDLYLFSTPGRTELAGNHTDHNHGQVLAASIHLDALALVFPRIRLRKSPSSAGSGSRRARSTLNSPSKPAERSTILRSARGKTSAKASR